MGLRNTTNNRRCLSSQRLMNPILVVAIPKGFKFSFQVVRIPNKEMIQVFTTNRSNQSLNEGM